MILTGIGFYPTAGGIGAFREELAAYAASKGAVRLPIDRSLPLDLIRRIVRFRVEENRRSAAATSPAHRRSLDQES